MDSATRQTPVDNEARRLAACRAGTCPTSIPRPTAPSWPATSPPPRPAPSVPDAHTRASSPTLPGADLAAAIAEYERMQEILGRVLSYAALPIRPTMSDPEIGRFYQTMHERVTAISTHAPVLHAGAQPPGRRGAGGQAGKAPELGALRARGCATCACSARTSCRDELEKLLHEK